MNNQILTNPAPLARSVAIVAALVIAALLAIPAAGQAHSAKKFGADLSSGATPVAAPVTCPNAMKSCTHVPVFYDQPAHAGKVPFAPKNGTVTQIRLRSANPGSVRIQLARQKGAAPTFQAKIVGQGPKLHYKGTGGVEKFDVNIPVHQGEWVALQAKNLSAISCDESMSDNDGVFQNPLQLGGPFEFAGSFQSCTPLVQAVMH